MVTRAMTSRVESEAHESARAKSINACILGLCLERYASRQDWLEVQPLKTRHIRDKTMHTYSGRYCARKDSITKDKLYKSVIAKQCQFYISVLRKHAAPKYAQIRVLSVIAW